MKFHFSLLNLLRHIYIYILIILAFSVTTIYLMYAAYSIPVEKIRENTQNSMSYLFQQPYRRSHFTYGLPIDTFTDSIILNNASFLENKNKLQNALLNPRAEYGRTPELNLSIALNREDLSQAIIINYTQYWHGYLILIKPLLFFFNLAQIRIINLIFEITLLITILTLIYRRLGFKHCIAFLISICFLNPLITWMCLEYVGNINILLLACLYILLNKNPDNNYMFFIIGALIIIFTYPAFSLASLGIPLIMHICLYKRNFSNNIKCIIKNSFLWGLGFNLMMVSKWLFATLLTKENIIKDGFDQIAHRTYGGLDWDLSKKDLITPLNAIKVNLSVIQNIDTVILLSIFLLTIFLSYFTTPYRFKWNNKSLIVLGIGLMPFAWYCLLVNHSVIHPHFTYKILTITIYAILTAIICSLQEKHN